MAVAVNILVDETADGAPPVASGSVTPAAGSMLIAFVYRNGFPIADPVLGGTLSGTWTKVGATQQQTNSVSTTIWKCSNPTGSGTISVSSGDFLSFCVLEVTGTDGTVVQSAGNSLGFQVSSGVTATLVAAPNGTTITWGSQGVPRTFAGLTGTAIAINSQGGKYHAAQSTPGVQASTLSWNINSEQATIHILEVQAAADPYKPVRGIPWIGVDLVAPAANVDVSAIADFAYWLQYPGLTGNDGDAISTWDATGSAISLVGSAGNRPVIKSGSNGLNDRRVARFDGSDDFLRNGVSTPAVSIDGTKGFTGFIIVKNRDTSNNGSVVSKTSGSTYEWGLSISTGVNFQTWQVAGANYSATGLQGAGSIIQDRWHIVAFRCDVNVKTSVYVDGPSVGSTSSFAGSQTLNSANKLSIGRRGDDVQPSTSDVAALLIYTRALSAAEMNSVYSRLKYDYAINYSPMVAV